MYCSLCSIVDTSHSGYVLFPCRKNGCLTDYMLDSSARQRKVESPGDEDKFTYIDVLLYMEQGMGQRLAYFPCFGAIFLEF